MSRLLAAQRAFLAPAWARNSLYRLAGSVPSLDQPFAEDRSLVDRISGRQLITYTRSSVGAYVDSGRVLRTAAVDEPRFDHDPATGESLGLLVEEQRTNLLTYSEDVSQWASPFNTTLTTNSIAAPNGATTANRLLETTATNLHTCDGTAFTFVTGTTYTYSVFVKPIGSRNFEIAFPTTVFTARFARFTLSGSGSVQGTDAGVTASISSLQNGWYRCVAISTCASGASSRIGNFINDSSNSRSYTGDTSAGIYIWGAQLEAGAFPTSYIQTTSAAATRNADIASITGTNFSSLYNQGEGALYYGGSIFGIPPSGTDYRRIVAATGSNINTDEISIYRRSSDGLLGGAITTSGTGFFDEGFLSNPINTVFKAAIAYKTNDTAFGFDGRASATDTTVALPAATALQIGQAIRFQSMPNAIIRRLTYWPTRLPNSTLQRLTQ